MINIFLDLVINMIWRGIELWSLKQNRAFANLLFIKNVFSICKNIRELSNILSTCKQICLLPLICSHFLIKYLNENFDFFSACKSRLFCELFTCFTTRVLNKFVMQNLSYNAVCLTKGCLLQISWLSLISTSLWKLTKSCLVFN